MELGFDFLLGFSTCALIYIVADAFKYSLSAYASRKNAQAAMTMMRVVSFGHKKGEDNEGKK
jgi:predicted membrane protein